MAVKKTQKRPFYQGYNASGMLFSADVVIRIAKIFPKGSFIPQNDFFSRVSVGDLQAN